MVRTITYTLTGHPGLIRLSRMESPRICQIDLAGFTKGNSSTKTEFQRRRPVTSKRRKITSSVKKETNAALLESLAAGESDSNVSVV